MRRTVAVIALHFGCAAGSAPAPGPADAPALPIPELRIDETWKIVEQDPTQIVLRYRDTADGVRLNLTRTAEGRWPGIAPIFNGKTWEIRASDGIRPAFMAPLTDRPPSEVIVETQGPDLLIRYAGIPLSGLVDHPKAPADPVLTWVRLRPRPGSTKITLQGLHVWSLDAPVVVDELGDTRVLTSPWGRLTVDGVPPAARSYGGADGWWIDTTPSADAREPYPRLAITWWPPRKVVSPSPSPP